MSGVDYVPPPPTAPPAGPSAVFPVGEPAPAETLPDGTSKAPRFWLRSLQSRLVAGVVSLVLVLVLAICACTYVALRSFLFDRLDQQLTLVANSNANTVAHCLRLGFEQRCTIGDPEENYRAPQTEWLSVLDTNGRQFGQVNDSRNLKQLGLSSESARAILASPTSVRKLTSGGTDLRVTARPIAGPTGTIFVVSGLSTTEIHRTIGRLLSIELIIGVSAIFLAFLITTLGVRRSLRNLYAVTGTAREVAAELSPTGAGLDRRVPVVDETSEVGQLAESMNTLLAAVETQFAARLESEHRMRQFLADASHELRTPLTSIRGYAELARMQRAAGAVDEGDNLHRIESEGTRMSRLVDDLLLLARGDADDAALTMRRELVDVSELLDDAVSGARAAHPERPISIEASEIPNVIGDRDELLRVVRNLITNAAVHTEPGRPISVRGWAEPGSVLIAVVDGGPGLPPEQAAHVFERFWRADKARTRARGGSGLGLSIVDTIVRAHGGTVGFESSVEAGSTVTVRLPAAE